ncbi:DUF6194 family protein [Rhodococcus daqingensis]|uniref:DUF6194 family protein n=1 Tax=Rhodococcus daqingensis TaxID=2479363 RepID=A0ABW2RS49_9NOCA
MTTEAAGEGASIDAAMGAADIIELVAGMAGVHVLTASRATGAPEAAWGDTFFSYDPDGDLPADRRFPFATIVTTDYDGFDTASNLNRPGVFRLNISVGRDRFRDLVGHSPAAHAEHGDGIDYGALDRLLPHPVYASQAWVSILNPGAATAALARALLAEAHARATAQQRKH